MALAENALTTFDNVQAVLGRKAPESKKSYIEAVINGVSEAFQRVANRTFHFRQNIVVQVPAFNTAQILVPDAPINRLRDIQYLSEFSGVLIQIVQLEEVRIKGDSPILWYSRGWSNTAPFRRAASIYPLHGEEGRLWEITYDAGYRTPKQETTVFLDNVQPKLLPADIELSVIQSIASVLRRGFNDLNTVSRTERDQTTAYRDTTGQAFLLAETKKVALSYQFPVIL